MPPQHHRTRWFLLTVAAFTLGAGLAQVVISHRDLAPSVVAAPALDPVDLMAPTPSDQVDRVEPRPAAAPRRITTTRPIAVKRPVPVRRAPQRHHVVQAHHAPTTSFEQDLKHAVAQIPFYREGVATWVVYPGLANYAITDREHRIVYVNPRTPRQLLFSVAAHEWGHVISTTGYGGDLASADAAVMRWFGVSSASRAIELAADCVARDLGATWTHYTSCTNSHWRYGARYLMVGWKLPEQSD